MHVVEINSKTKTYRGPWTWPDNSVLVDIQMPLEEAIAAGYTPEPVVTPVPFSVPKWAFLCVIRARGKEDALKAAVAGYTGPNSERVRAKFEVDPEVERNGATINAIGAAMGFTPLEIDDLFREMAAVEASQ